MIKFIKNIFSLKPKGPAYLIHFITNQCNARCRHCFIFQKTIVNRYFGKELSLGEIKKMAVSLSPTLSHVNLTGGEPFLRNDLVNIVNLYAQEAKASSIQITTNGSLPFRISKCVSQILKQNPKTSLSISISIDNLGKKHDQNRRFPGLFKKILKTYRLLDKLKAEKLTVNFNLVVTGQSQNDLENIFKFLTQKLQIKSLSSTAFRIKRRDLKTHFDLQQFTHLNRLINQAFFTGQLSGFNGFPGADFINAKNILQRELIEKTIKNKRFIAPCQAGKLAAVIHANGDVYPCELLDKKIGNLSKYDFTFPKLWQSQEAQTARQFIKKTRCFCTHECFWGVNLLSNPKFYPKILKNYFKIKANRIKHVA